MDVLQIPGRVLRAVMYSTMKISALKPGELPLYSSSSTDLRKSRELRVHNREGYKDTDYQWTVTYIFFGSRNMPYC